MKLARVLKVALAAGALAAVAFAIAVWIIARDSRRPVRVDGPKLVAALKAFTEEHGSQGVAVPSPISLDTLIERGLLSTDAVFRPEGVDLVIYPDADESRPGGVLVEARLPDGSLLAVLADGSVQMLSGIRITGNDPEGEER